MKNLVRNSEKIHPSAEVCAVILAGGEGQRMGKRNKGLISLQQRPLVAHVLERLHGQIPYIVISANDDLDAYAQFGVPVIPDINNDYCGPLAGIYSVLNIVSTRWLITVPCDCPYLPQDYVTRMLAARHDHQAYVAHDGTRQQSGFCLLQATVLPVLHTALQAKQFAVHHFLTTLGSRIVNFSDEISAFVNINTPEDLAAAE